MLTKLLSMLTKRRPRIADQKRRLFSCNCPILEKTASGVSVGRCWLYLEDGNTCRFHGDVSTAVRKYQETGQLTLESK